MAITCEKVWLEVSNFLDGEVDPELRLTMEEHIRGCTRCTAVLEGTRNVIALYGDERMLEVPLGFSRRMERRLAESMPAKLPPSTRRGFLGWMVAAAAAVLIAGGVEAFQSSTSSHPNLRSQLARPGTGVPPDMMVVVAAEGKTFHVAGCEFLHDKKNLRVIRADEATREGYTPCVRCMKQYLTVARSYPDQDEEKSADSIGPRQS